MGCIWGEPKRTAPNFHLTRDLGQIWSLSYGGEGLLGCVLDRRANPGWDKWGANKPRHVEKNLDRHKKSSRKWKSRALAKDIGQAQKSITKTPSSALAFTAVSHVSMSNWSGMNYPEMSQSILDCTTSKTPGQEVQEGTLARSLHEIERRTLSGLSRDDTINIRLYDQ